MIQKMLKKQMCLLITTVRLHLHSKLYSLRHLLLILHLRFRFHLRLRFCLDFGFRFDL